MATEQEQKADEFITINQVLNSKPQLGPIPGEQVIAWSLILVVDYILCKGVFGLNWMATGLVGAWDIASWWTLTGDASWKFLSKFQGVPRMTIGNAPYLSLLEPPTKQSKTRSQRKKPTQKRRQRR